MADAIAANGGGEESCSGSALLSQADEGSPGVGDHFFDRLVASFLVEGLEAEARIPASVAAQGIFYNVPPLRTKDKAYFDVISESINNPIRLLIGWAIVDPTSLPPGSIILSY